MTLMIEELERKRKIKKLVYLLFASYSLVLMFTGCKGVPEETPPVNDTDLRGDENGLSDIENQGGIVVEVEPRRIYINEIPNFVRLTIRNLSDVAYRGGFHYAIDYHDGDNWIMIVAPIVPDKEIVIEPGETFVLEFAQLMPDYHNYVAGRYRVRFGNWHAEFSIFERTP